MHGRTLRRIRRRLGMTQPALAVTLGVHRVTIARWETGSRAVPRLVALLMVRLDEEGRSDKANR